MRIKHIFLDYSSIQAFARCKRKFMLSLVKGLVKAQLRDNSLDAAYRGTLVHAALDARAKHMAWEPIIEALIPEDSSLRELDSSRSGSIVHIKNLVKAYEANYAADGLVALATEQTMQMPLGPRVTYQGTVDKIVRAVDGTISVLDHKCSSSLRLYIEPTISLSDQFTGYLVLAQAQGFATNTMIVDGISTALKALADGVGLFVRYETERTPEQIDNFKVRMEIIGEEIIDFIEHHEMFQENISLPTPACNEFGTKCAFLEVCTAGVSAANVLKNLYIKNLDPWKNFRIIIDEDL